MAAVESAKCSWLFVLVVVAICVVVGAVVAVLVVWL